MSNNDHNDRWWRAAAWARGQSLGPWGQGVDPSECRRIEALRDRILEVGEDQAAAEHLRVELAPLDPPG